MIEEMDQTCRNISENVVKKKNKYGVRQPYCKTHINWIRNSAVKQFNHSLSQRINGPIDWWIIKAWNPFMLQSLKQQNPQHGTIKGSKFIPAMVQTK